MADNDEYDCIDDEMDAIETEVLPRKGVHRAATQAIPELMISLMLTRDQVARLRRDRTTCMAIEAPSAEWVDPLLRAGKRLGEWKFSGCALLPRCRRGRMGLPLQIASLLSRRVGATRANLGGMNRPPRVSMRVQNQTGRSARPHLRSAEGGGSDRRFDPVRSGAPPESTAAS